MGHSIDRRTRAPGLVGFNREFVCVCVCVCVCVYTHGKAGEGSGQAIKHSASENLYQHQNHTYKRKTGNQ